MQLQDYRDRWFIHASDNEKLLYVSREKEKRSKAFSPCDMTPDDVDYEMSCGKNRTMIRICGMKQDSFEYFVEKYGDTYEYLSFFKSQFITDFSPLSKLKNLQGVDIYWNIRADKLWDMSENTSLEYLNIADCKKITYDLPMLNTGKSLKCLQVAGDIFSGYPMKNLHCFSEMESLQQLRLLQIKLEDHDTSFIETLPNLKHFDFPAGMLLTEEIAYICAKYPALKGTALCAYNTEDAILNDVRICGHRKPSLDLPQHQKRLDKYVAEFNALVEKYREELNILK